MTLKLTDGRGLPARQRRKASDENDGNMSTRENRELWGETKQHRGMEDFLVRRIRSRNEVPLTLICSTSSEISQRGRIM